MSLKEVLPLQFDGGRAFKEFIEIKVALLLAMLSIVIRVYHHGSPTVSTITTPWYSSLSWQYTTVSSSLQA